ncbi:DUF2172 domain-containing protein, partial [Rhodospirillales bacterium]|nr:DUF2172 domain-containing protein [Rhodospirillales bacterium]
MSTSTPNLYWETDDQYLNEYKLVGEQIYEFAKNIFPITRSIMGPGVRKTFEHIQKQLPELELHEVPSKTHCFDWIVPNEWSIEDAYIANMAGDIIINFDHHNLHVVSYSDAIDKVVTRKELDQHLHSIPELPEAI